jgi:hypothetical protein
MASLYGQGSGSAVFLVHGGESPAGASPNDRPGNEDQLLGTPVDRPGDRSLSPGPDEREMNPAGVSQLRTGCYHTGYMNVL